MHIYIYIYVFIYIHIYIYTHILMHYACVQVLPRAGWLWGVEASFGGLNIRNPKSRALGFRVFGIW